MEASRPRYMHITGCRTPSLKFKGIYLYPRLRLFLRRGAGVATRTSECVLISSEIRNLHRLPSEHTEGHLDSLNIPKQSCLTLIPVAIHAVGHIQKDLEHPLLYGLKCLICMMESWRQNVHTCIRKSIMLMFYFSKKKYFLESIRGGWPLPPFCGPRYKYSPSFICSKV